MRYGADTGLGALLENLGVAVAGNVAGRAGTVTFARSAQARAGR